MTKLLGKPDNQWLKKKLEGPHLLKKDIAEIEDKINELIKGFEERNNCVVIPMRRGDAEMAHTKEAFRMQVIVPVLSLDDID